MKQESERNYTANLFVLPFSRIHLHLIKIELKFELWIRTKIGSFNENISIPFYNYN